MPVRVCSDPHPAFLPSLSVLFCLLVEGYEGKVQLNGSAVSSGRPPAPPVSAAAPPSILTRPSHPPTFVKQADRNVLIPRPKTQGEGGGSLSLDFKMTLTLFSVFQAHTEAFDPVGGVIDQRTLPFDFVFLMRSGSCSWSRAR